MARNRAKNRRSSINAFIRNNIIHSYKIHSNNHISDQCIGILITQNAQADIINNLIYDCFDSSFNGNENRVGLGIYVNSTTGTKIFGNAIWNCYVDRGGNSVSRLLSLRSFSGSSFA